MTKPCIKILVEADSAIESAFPQFLIQTRLSIEIKGRPAPWANLQSRNQKRAEKQALPIPRLSSSIQYVSRLMPAHVVCTICGRSWSACSAAVRSPTILCMSTASASRIAANRFLKIFSDGSRSLKAGMSGQGLGVSSDWCLKCYFRASPSLYCGVAATDLPSPLGAVDRVLS